MTRFDRIVREHRETGRERLEDLAAEVRALASDAGLDVRFFGSFAHGTVDGQSDLDVLILGERRGIKVELVRRAIEELGAARHVRVDVVLARDAPHLLRRAVP